MDNKDPPRTQHTVQALTYNELYQLTESLKSRLKVLEETSAKADSSPSADSVPRACNDYRLLPDLNRTVPVFTGHESSCTAEDWINTVEALAAINNWRVPYRLQYVKSNMSNAARS